MKSDPPASVGCRQLRSRSRFFFVFLCRFLSGPATAPGQLCRRVVLVHGAERRQGKHREDPEGVRLLWRGTQQQQRIDLVALSPQSSLWSPVPKTPLSSFRFQASALFACESSRQFQFFPCCRWRGAALANSSPPVFVSLLLCADVSVEERTRATRAITPRAGEANDCRCVRPRLCGACAPEASRKQQPQHKRVSVCACPRGRLVRSELLFVLRKETRADPTAGRRGAFSFVVRSLVVHTSRSDASPCCELVARVVAS